MDDTARRLQAFWNERFTPEAFAYGTEPNTFLVDTLARHGTAQVVQWVLRR